MDSKSRGIRKHNMYNLLAITKVTKRKREIRTRGMKVHNNMFVLPITTLTRIRYREQNTLTKYNNMLSLTIIRVTKRKRESTTRGIKVLVTNNHINHDTLQTVKHLKQIDNKMNLSARVTKISYRKSRRIRKKVYKHIFVINS